MLLFLFLFLASTKKDVPFFSRMLAINEASHGKKEEDKNMRERGGI